MISVQTLYPPATELRHSPTSKNEVHIINVDKNDLAFEPNRLSVLVSDTIEFHFWSKTHSVAQSDFGRRCTPRREGMFGDVREFYRGPVTVASGESPRVLRIQVNNTVSIFFSNVPSTDIVKMGWRELLMSKLDQAVLRPIPSFLRWIFRIAANLFINHSEKWVILQHIPLKQTLQKQQTSRKRLFPIGS
jgi:plastocyanin